MKIFSTINNHLHTPIWLFFLLVIVLIARIPTFFEPYAYGDEMIYLTLGEAIRQGVPLYKGVHDNKPPLLYILAALGGNLFWFRAILALWHLTTIFVFWKLVEAFFPKDTKIQKIATFIFALLTTIPLLEGTIANSELFMIGPTMLAFVLLLAKKLTTKKIVAAGILFSVSTLFKVPALFDIPTIVFFWLATYKLSIKNLRLITKRTFLIGISYLVPIVATFLWYYSQGALKEYFIAAFGQNLGYVSSFRPADAVEPFFVRNAPLLLRAGITGLSLFMIYLSRKKLSREFLFFTSWLILTTFAVTLSERPYPHYLVQSVPALSILFAMLIAFKNKEQSLVILPLTLFLIAPVYYKFWYYPSLPYYTRFIDYATGKSTLEKYQSSFGENVVRNYKIAHFIENNSQDTDTLFVWGDTATIYALTHKLPPMKYVADYHIHDFSSFEETSEKLTHSPPAYIVIMPNATSFPELTTIISQYYGFPTVIEGAEVWKLLNPKLRSLIAE